MADRFCSSCGQELPVEVLAADLELVEEEEPVVVIEAPASEADVVAEVAHHALDTIESIVEAHEATDLVAELADVVETVAEEESEEAIVDAVADDEPDEEPDEEPDDDEGTVDDDELGEDDDDDVDESIAELLEPADEIVVEEHQPVAAQRRRRGLPMRR